jgi:hypothetical protein
MGLSWPDTVVPTSITVQQQPLAAVPRYLVPRLVVEKSCHLLNVSDGRSGETETPGTENDWITVVLKKKNSGTKRAMSRVSAVKKESVSRTNGEHMNGQRNDKRVSFAEDRNNLILF